MILGEILTSLCTNIPQVEGINIVCTAYENYYRDALLPPPPPQAFARESTYSFQFKEQKYLRTHGTAMVTKKAVTFANIFMVKIETQIFD